MHEELDIWLYEEMGRWMVDNYLTQGSMRMDTNQSGSSWEAITLKPPR